MPYRLLRALLRPAGCGSRHEKAVPLPRFQRSGKAPNSLIQVLSNLMSIFAERINNHPALLLQHYER